MQRLPMQLNKYLAQCGVASRRKSNEPIVHGRVRVNGELIQELGVVVQPGKDEVTLDGKKLKLPSQYFYVLLNKPKGVVTTAKDDRGRQTVLDLLPKKERLFSVGRLDYDTEGVLLLTNDGDLAYRLAHPRFEIDKIYEAWVKGDVQPETLQKIAKGIYVFELGKLKAEAEVLQKRQGKSLLQIRIHEGKKRQVKRMLKTVGHPVTALKRTCFAGLTVHGMQSGEWRLLNKKEVMLLYKNTGLEPEADMI